MACFTISSSVTYKVGIVVCSFVEWSSSRSAFCSSAAALPFSHSLSLSPIRSPTGSSIGRAHSHMSDQYFSPSGVTCNYADLVNQYPKSPRCVTCQWRPPVCGSREYGTWLSGGGAGRRWLMRDSPLHIGWVWWRGRTAHWDRGSRARWTSPGTRSWASPTRHLRWTPKRAFSETEYFKIVHGFSARKLDLETNCPLRGLGCFRHNNYKERHYR